MEVLIDKTVEVTKESASFEKGYQGKVTKESDRWLTLDDKSRISRKSVAVIVEASEPKQAPAKNKEYKWEETDTGRCITNEDTGVVLIDNFTNNPHQLVIPDYKTGDIFILKGEQVTEHMTKRLAIAVVKGKTEQEIASEFSMANTQSKVWEIASDEDKSLNSRIKELHDNYNLGVKEITNNLGVKYSRVSSYVRNKLKNNAE